MPVGSPCTADVDCAGGRCIVEQVVNGTTQFVGGYCTARCTALPDFTDTCPTGSVCAAPYVGVRSSCLRLCDAGALSQFGGCRGGYQCAPFDGDTRFGVCLPL
jgi:hypothetical protein